MCVAFRVSVAESSALKALQEKLFAHRSELMTAFQQHDLYNTGKMTLIHPTCKCDCIFLSPPHSVPLRFSSHVPRQALHQRMGSSSGIGAEVGSPMAYLETTSCAPGLWRKRRIRIVLRKHRSRATHATGFTSCHAIRVVQTKKFKCVAFKYSFIRYECNTYYGQVRQCQALGFE